MTSYRGDIGHRILVCPGAGFSVYLSMTLPAGAFLGLVGGKPGPIKLAIKGIDKYGFGLKL